MPKLAHTVRALVVDDDEINRMIAIELLAMHAVAADEAQDGAACLAMLRAATYDLLLLDVSMPDMDGPTVCGMIRQDPALRDIYVVAYTAHAFPGQKEQFLAAGFDALLTKPISCEGMADAIRPVCSV